MFGVRFTVGVTVGRLVWNDRGWGIVVGKDGGSGLRHLGVLDAR
jgi:hypothetical protein